MSKTKAETIISRLLSNVADLKFGSASVTIKVHDGRVTQVSYETTVSMREESDAGRDKK
jgi:hypothetical protein